MMIDMTSRTNRWLTWLLIGSVSLCAAHGVAAQDDPPPVQEEQADDPPPSLDDLLGIDEEDRDDGAEEAAEQARQDELDRQLNEEEISDAFMQAVELMRVSATRLDEDFDSGLGTQRIQEDIIARLETLIDQAQQQMQQNQQQSSSSSSSQQRSQQQQQQDPGSRQRQQEDQQGQQQQQDAQRNPEGSEAQEGDGPARQNELLNPLLDVEGSEWGSLPERARDMLLQGRREKYSSLYERMTREYYRRLAEESSGGGS